MPRYARLHAPGHIVHAISRFVNREFRLDDKGRSLYLTRLDRVLARTDWQLIAYALMSSHTHLALVAGAEPFWRLAKALNTAVGGYLNQSQGRSGPVFEGRPFTSVIEGVHAARLVRYLHNNPVRARKCAEARECSWTSHRAYLGLRGDSAALNVTAGLDLCGFGGSTAGRSHFDEHVLAHGADGRDPLLTGDGVHDRRLRVRKALGAAAELSSPQVVDGRVVQAILVPKEGRLRLEWEGSLEPILEAACDEVGTSPELARTSRTAAAGFARSVFLWAAHRDMGVTLTSAAAFLGRSVHAGSHALRRAADRPEVARIANEIAANLGRSHGLAAG